MPTVSQNPAFQLPNSGLRREWDRMRASPKPLARPLVVLSGWRAPGWPGALLARQLRLLVGEQNRGTTLAVPFTFIRQLDDGAVRVIEHVERRWPGPDRDQTVEVDVVGISMGGLIARAAAAGLHSGKRLRVARLFTLGTPHRGARVARWLRPDALVRGMQPGSAFLANLDRALADAPYELICYARLGDSWVGARNAAPTDREPIWKPGPPLLSHQTISTDRLMRTDIARRLRGEDPLAHAASPPPRN